MRILAVLLATSLALGSAASAGFVVEATGSGNQIPPLPERRCPPTLDEPCPPPGTTESSMSQSSVYNFRVMRRLGIIPGSCAKRICTSSCCQL